MHTAGFFRELDHGLPDGPRIAEALADPLEEAERPVIAQYLRECKVVAATSEQADDVVDESRTSVSPINIRTDGETVWPEDLAYYVEQYGVRPPPPLLERARTGTAPQISRQELDAVIGWMQSGMPED